MLRKTIVAGAALLAASFGAFTATSLPAQAKTDVHFGIYVGVPGPVYDPVPVYDYDPWDYAWAPEVIYAPGYYYHRPYYRRVYHYHRPYIRHVRHYRPRWREICTARRVRVRYWNGYRWRWRTVRRARRCRWVRR